MKLNRQFTKRETVLILVLAIILLVLVYWWFVYRPVQEQMSSYDTADIDSQIQIEQARAMQKKKMQDEMDSNKQANIGEIATYNNLKNEINELNTIVSKATSYSFDFEDPYADGEIVRRNINLTFTAASYANAEDIIKGLYGCRYRLLIGDLSITPSGDSGVIQDGPVSVSATLTFFETTYGAQNTDGLIVEDDGSGTNSGDTSSDSSTDGTVSSAS